MKNILKRNLFIISLIIIGSQSTLASNLVNGDNINSTLNYGKSIIGHKGNYIEESLNEMDKTLEKRVVEVTDGVYSVIGVNLNNTNIIESDNGIIIIDGGMTEKDAFEVQSLLPKEVANKPVKAVIYSHWHYIAGAGAWNIDEDTQVIAHENHTSEIQASGANPVLADVSLTRMKIQLGYYLPQEGIDAPSDAGGMKEAHASSHNYYLAPTTLVGDEESHFDIDGVQFITSGAHSDTVDGLSVYFPEKKVSVDNIYWGVMMNLSTVRGDRWRNPQSIIEAGEWLLSKDIEYSLKIHSDPTDGETFRQQITDQNEYIQVVMDETVKAIGEGMSPDEIQYSVKLPEHLLNSPHLKQNYGEFNYHVRRYYSYLLHFFGNDSIELHPLERDNEAEKMVEVIGGINKVRKEAKEAFDNGDYQWSAQLATYGIRSGDHISKQIKADALRAMAQVATASNTRNWYLTHALVLEGKIEFPIILTGEY